ncbi:MAG: GNAT family N-acetyltransferase [Candidatus Heimdallarchaeaceae archaeon]
MSSEIIFKEIEDEESFSKIENIEREAWGMPDLELVPRRLFKATKRSGAVLIGAYDRDELIGYVWGWIGNLPEYGFFIYSHHNAVKKAYQNLGLGFKLKIEQRKWAIKKGFKLINWTFDPLQSKNAFLNLHKLGAVCNTYKENYWGEMHDAENIGLPTDRFYVNWYIESRRVEDSLQSKFDDYSSSLKSANLVLSAERKDNFLHPTDLKLNICKDLLFVRIPPNINEIKKENNSLAIEWRMKTRKVLQHYLKKNYTIVDLYVMKNPEEIETYYVLQKNFEL